MDEGLEGHILIGAEREDKDEKCSWEITQEDLEKLGPCEGSVGYIFSEEYGCSTLFGCEFDPEIVPFKTQGECELACGRMWSCWAINIKEEGKTELDKTWIDGINKILSEEIPSQLCIEEGGRGYWGEDECCSGLTSLSRWTICDTPGDKRGCNENGCFPPPPDGSFICTKCGDKICGLGENRCNCPKDCSEEFCSWSTYAKCKTDADCNMGGCSGEVCEGKGEGTITDCMWRDCYYVTGYKCKCIDGRCQWSK